MCIRDSVMSVGQGMNEISRVLEEGLDQIQHQLKH